jgi:ABC-type branched-subunit amino acid transport system ATPase component
VAPDPPTLLRISDLRKEFDGVVALDGVSLDIPPGGVFGLIGPNGAGKTTLFNVVSGLHRATSGTVRLADRLLTGRSQHRIAGIGVARTFQNLQIFGHMSVLDNVLVGCHRHGSLGLLPTLLRLPASHAEERRLRDRALEALAFAGLADLAGDPAADLPPGRQRLVEIARALALQPALLLLDEPAAGLTTRETEALGELIHRIADTGLTTLLIEHDMSLVRQVCSRVAVLDQGKLLAVDTPTAIQSNPQVIAAYLGQEEDE